MQRIRRGRVEGSLVTCDDRGSVRHGVHQLGTPLDGGEAVRGHCDRRDRHAVELRGVEHREVPEHKALLLVPGFGVCFGVDLPEDDRDAALALADAAPSRFHLGERGPERGRVAHRRQQPDVDAAIGPLAEKIARQPRRVVPGLLPGHCALLQQCENPVRYHLVRCVDLLCYTHGMNLHGCGRLTSVAVGEIAPPQRLLFIARRAAPYRCTRCRRRPGGCTRYPARCATVASPPRAGDTTRSPGGSGPARPARGALQTWPGVVRRPRTGVPCRQPDAVARVGYRGGDPTPDLSRPNIRGRLGEMTAWTVSFLWFF